jgi:ubiquinone/menaquinone biosynthesis C-methylase UbiE
VLEIGAGACWLSAEISKLDAVEQVHAVDFSRTLLERIAPGIIEHVGGEARKITRVVGDFNDLDFPDETFDHVVCDAALHHANDPAWLLRELARVLKSDGTLVAVREPILSEVGMLAARQARLFGLEERRFGVTERIYRREEWRRFFEEAGFSMRFVPFIHHTTMKGRVVRFSPLRFLNGFLFHVGPLVAEKHARRGPR